MRSIFFGINILKVWFAPKNDREFGILLILAFAIFFTLKNLFLFLSVSWRNWFLRGCEVDVSKNLLAGYLARPYEMHARRNSTELIRNIGECVPSLYGGVLGNTALIISEILVSLAIITLLFLVDPFTAFLALVLVGGGGAITYGLLRRSMTDLGKDRPEAKRQQLQCLQQSLGGLKEVKILQKEKFFVEQLEKIQIWLQFIHVKLAAFTELPRLTLEALMIWTVVLVIYFNSFQGVSPENDLIGYLSFICGCRI